MSAATQSIFTPELAAEVRRRAVTAESNDQLTAAVFDALRQQGTDVDSVPLEDIKRLVVEAVRSARGRCA